MKYWWVNQGQTHNQEINGSYLWSPKREKDGRRSQFYDNMRRASPGDIVFSYVRQQISHIGCVEDYAVTAFKPEEFKPIDNNWNIDGWLLPVKWTAINPINIRENLDLILTLMPEKYAPLEKSGRGAQKAYLTEISHKLFSTLCEINKITLPKLLFQNIIGKSKNFTRTIENNIVNLIKNNINITDTEKEQLKLSRIGQGTYRAKVLKIENKCRLTGIGDPRLLIASHIKPWRLCLDGNERLDGNNGLMLTPNADLLFDRGMISFEDDGTPLISNVIDRTVLERLVNIVQADEIKLPFNEAQSAYLDYHRKNIFIERDI